MSAEPSSAKSGHRRCASTAFYVITVGASRPVSCFMLDSRSATSTSGASAVAASACRRSGPASGATYCSTYMRMVAPDEPVPARPKPPIC